jgi:hypothetical protein
MTTIVFTDGCAEFDHDSVIKQSKYFELIEHLIADYHEDITHIFLNCDAYSVKKQTFMQLLEMCSTLQIDPSMGTLCEYLLCRIPIGMSHKDMCAHAIVMNDLILLELVYDTGCEMTFAMFEYAIEQNHRNQPAKCLRFLLDHAPRAVHCRNVMTRMNLCDTAASVGNFECLKLANERGCKMTDSTRSLALRADSLECLKYACEVSGSFTLRPGTACIRRNCMGYYKEHFGPI